MPTRDELAEIREEGRERWNTGHGAGQRIPAHTDEGELQVLASRMGQPVPWVYGRHLVAGTPVLQHKDTDGNTFLFVALGDGEWDAAETVWVNGKVINIADSSKIHFHPGLDGESGTETDPATRNQKICSFFPAGFTQTTFSRTAYIALKLAPDPTAPSAQFDVRGIYRARRLRIFDAAGNQTAYQYSANPAWQLLDAFIGLHLLPGATINQALTSAEKSRIDFPAFAEAAADCDVDIGAGVKRFESNVAFLENLNLSQMFETFLALCRGYLLEQDGKFGLYVDKARASIYTFAADQIKAWSLATSAQDLRAQVNRLVVKIRDTESGGADHSKDFAPWTKTLDAQTHQDQIGRIIKKEVDFGANTCERAERVGWYWLNRALLENQCRLFSTLDAGKLLPGDHVTGPRDHSYSATREFEILEATDEPDGNREFFLQEYDPTIFSDTAESQQDTEETNIPAGYSPPVSDTVAYRPTSNMLTASDAGASATINIAAFTLRVAGQADVSYNLGSISALAFNTFYFIYCDDPTWRGGTQTYEATVTKEEALNGAGRIFLGSIRTPADGAPDTIGNNDGGVGAQSGLSHRAYFPDYATAVTGNGAVSNPELAVDLIMETAASLSLTGNSGANSASIRTKGLAAALEPSATGRKVWVIFEIPTNTLNGSGNVWSLYYSETGDSGYILWDSGGAGVTKARTTYSMDIPQWKLADVRVRLDVMAGASQTTGTITAKLYESWVEVF
jgi:hypothetical protein